jgi:hypothetical protein
MVAAECKSGPRKKLELLSLEAQLVPLGDVDALKNKILSSLVNEEIVTETRPLQNVMVKLGNLSVATQFLKVIPNS